MITSYSKNILLKIFFVTIVLFQQNYSIQLKYVGLYEEFISVITVDPTKTNTMYVGTISNFSSGHTGSLFKTTDGGILWDTLLHVVTVTDIDIHPHDANIIYASIGVSFFSPPKILKSYDGGKNWVRSDSGIFMSSLIGPSKLEIDPMNPEKLYVGTSGIQGGNFYKSNNGGKYWTTRGDSTNFILGITAIAINPDSQNVIFAGTNQSGDVYRSSDYGETWMHTGLRSDLTLTITFGTPSSTIYVGSANNVYYNHGIFQSLDAGYSWSNIRDGIVDTVFDTKSILQLESDNSKYLYMTGNNHKFQPRIYYRKLEDKSWSLINLPDTLPQIHQLKLFKGKILFGTPRGLYAIDKPTNVIETSDRTVPNSIFLSQNYPNPFNPSTKIRFNIPEKTNIELSVFNVLGIQIATIKSGFVYEGDYLVDFDGSSFPSGIYFLKLQINNKHQLTRKMLLIK